MYKMLSQNKIMNGKGFSPTLGTELSINPVNEVDSILLSRSTSQLSNLLGFYGELEIQPFQKFK